MGKWNRGILGRRWEAAARLEVHDGGGSGTQGKRRRWCSGSVLREMARAQARRRHGELIGSCGVDRGDPRRRGNDYHRWGRRGGGGGTPR